MALATDSLQQPTRLVGLQQSKSRHQRIQFLHGLVDVQSRPQNAGVHCRIIRPILLACWCIGRWVVETARHRVIKARVLTAFLGPSAVSLWVTYGHL